MDACARCGFPLGAGAQACTRCGCELAPATAPGRGPRWGTLDIPKRVLADLQAERAAGSPPTAAGGPGSRRAESAPPDRSASKPLERLDAGDDWNPAPMVGSAAEADPDAAPLELDLGSPAGRGNPAGVARGRAPSAPVSASPDARPHPAARRAPTGPVAFEGGRRPGSGPENVGGRVAPGRAATGPVAHAAPAGARPRPVRGATGPVGPDAARAPSGSLGGPRVRAPSGALSNEPVARVALPRAASASLAAAHARQPHPVVQPIALQRAAAGPPDNSNHLETGMLEIDGRFAGAALNQDSVLDLASLKPQARPPDSSPPAPLAEAAREAPAPQRARRAQELARYGEPPTGPIGAIPYFLRVHSRRRVLEAQLLNLTQQRKRLDLASEDALCLLGQALYAKGADPQLKPLAAQLRTVSETAQAVGSRGMASRLSEEEQRFQLAALERERSQLAAEAAPDRMRDAALRQEIEAQVSQLKQSEQRVREAEAVVEAARSGAYASAEDQVAAARAERAHQLSLIQSARGELSRLRPALSAVQASLAKHAERLAQFDARRAKLVGTIDREQGRERISIGDAQSAAREALRALAGSALRNDLGRLAVDEARAAIDIQERATRQRESEELTRAAASSFDHSAYRRGWQLLTLTAVGTTFLMLAALIAL